LHEKALLQAFEQMATEWESTSCPVCQTDKWTRFPFCRRCSITLQRAGIYWRLKPFTGRRFAAIRRLFEREGNIPHVGTFFVLYDQARDLLVNWKRGQYRLRHHGKDKAET